MPISLADRLGQSIRLDLIARPCLKNATQTGSKERYRLRVAWEENMDAKTDDTGKWPFSGGKRGHTNRNWWPDALDIQVLHHNSNLSDPMGKTFDYAKEFKSLDLNAVIVDLNKL